jgi:hypothetical protein
MKRIIILALLCPQFILAQRTIDVQSHISDVIVYQQSAQVERSAKIDLPAGSSILRFPDMNTSIHPDQVKFSATGDFSVMSVSHEYKTDTISGVYDHKRAQEISVQKAQYQAEINLEQSYLHVYEKELALLANNQHFGNKEEGISVDELRQASEFIRQRHLDIRDKQVDIEQKVKSLQVQMGALDIELSGLSKALVTERTLEFLVRVQAPARSSAEVSLTYQMQQAGWHPSYDARVKDVETPMELEYRANVYQNTGENWEEVNLVIATGNPNLNNIKPNLNPWFLTRAQNNTYFNSGNANSYLQSQAHVQGITKVSGQMTDANTGEPLPGGTVSAVGGSVGSMTDLNGYFTVQIPPGISQLQFSYIGYNAINLNVSSSVMNIMLQPSQVHLDAVQISSGSRSERITAKSINKIPGRNIEGAVAAAPEVTFAPVQVAYTPANTQFRISVPYSIPSDGSQYAVTLDQLEMEADYLYKCTPKLDQKAYLFAQVSGWEDHNLLSGKMNVYYEEAYVGQSNLDLKFMSDTLSVSLGSDQSIHIERKRIRDNSSKQFISNKRKDTREWAITVKNNKRHNIRIQIDDQMPMSHREDIEIEHETLSGAEYDEFTGRLKWDVRIKPGKSEKVNFRYSVKYPKQLNLFL